jgi:hypothetical protein
MNKAILAACILTAMVAPKLLAQEEIPFSDTIKVNVGDSVHMQVTYKNRKVLENSRSLDYNSIMNQVNKSIDQVSPDKKVTKITFTMPGNTFVIHSDSIQNKANVSIETLVRDSAGNQEVVVNVTPKKQSKPKKRTFTDAYLDLGLNTWLKDGSTFVSSSEPYDLRPWGSRYAAFGVMGNTRIGGQKSPLYIQYGGELSWNNFMLQDDNRITETAQGLEFTPVDGRSFTRNKLVVNYLSVPVIPMIDFSHTRKNGFKFGVGGFAGYRIHSWTKQAYFEGGDKKKNKERDSYFLNDFRYGLIAVVGVEDIFDIFIKYDLNTLFESGKTVPNVQAVSFGIRL